VICTCDASVATATLRMPVPVAPEPRVMLTEVLLGRVLVVLISFLYTAFWGFIVWLR
jgi:hypothetical protein